MSIEDTSRLPDWHELYRLAVAETDPVKIIHRISEARKAILDHIQETLPKPASYRELQELSNALNSLRTVQQ